MRIIIWVLSLVFILCTLLPLVRHDDWWIRIFDFPRVQIAVGGLVTLFLFIFFYGKWNTAADILITTLLLCIAYQTYMMYPYTFFAKPQVLKSETNDLDRNLSILIANIYMKNRDHQKLLKAVDLHEPDVICVLEPDEWWAEKLKVLDDDYPHSIYRPSDDTYGMIFYSKLKAVKSKLNYILKDNVPSVHSILELKSGDQIELYCLHPDPPNPRYAEETTDRDAELLIVGKEAKKSDMPVVVTGDLNDVSWSYTTKLFQEISGLLDPRVGRGFFSTFHAKYPFARFPLDHIFVSESFRLINMSRLAEIGSDHFPILIELSYEPDNEEEQIKNIPDSEKEDKEKAEEMIDEAK